MIGRRPLIAAALALPDLAAPNLARAQSARTLRFVPQPNLGGLASLDPVYTPQYGTRNAALLVWDTLYGVDANLVPRPQMCAGHEETEGGRVWTFTLRPGLLFHDNTPVLARDAVASLLRWMARDANGQTIRATLDSIEALDDARFRIRLTRPFPRMLFALGKMNPPVAFIMPERIARTDPFKPIGEYIGSGPMMFRPGDWVPASRAVFDRFPAYAPRDEPASWMAGGKRMRVDRIEWTIIPDPATAAAALITGAVDWWQTPIPDLVPLLRRGGDVVVGLANPLGNIGAMRLNHLHPPFNDVRARRTLQLAVDQADYMQAIMGDDAAMWRRLPSVFTPGTPEYTGEGGEVMTGPRRLDEARRLLAESGYRGEKIVLLVAADVPIAKVQADVTNALLQQIGMNVDYLVTDLNARRARKDPPGKGGWHIFHTWHEGADCVDPLPNVAIRTSGDRAWFGWPRNDAIEGLIAQWFAEPGPARAQALMGAINAASMDFVTFIPTGFFQAYQAWRREITGVTAAPFPMFWGVAKG